MINLKPPNFGAGSTEEQIRQIQSYLYQLTQELNWALQTLETMISKKEE